MAKFTKLNIGDIVASSGGRVWKKLSAESTEVQDELAGTWVWNSNIDIDSITDGTEEFTVNFSSNGVNYTQLNIHNIILTSFRESWIYYGSDTVWGYDDGWYNTAYRTITITSKLSEVSYGSSLLSILKANATKQEVELGTFTYAQTNAWYSTPIVRQFPLGMTWAEFISSEYNAIAQDGEGDYAVVGQFIIRDDGQIMFSGANINGNAALTLAVYYDSSYTLVYGADVILDEGIYDSTHRSSGGSN